MTDTVVPTHPITWRDVLAERMSPAWAQEIDLFEGQMELARQGKLDPKVFAESRLRRGVYGQRYDNGQRHDGVRVQRLAYPHGWLKGPDTLWDAPGMQRIKVPFGGITPEQMETLADLAEEYATGVLHVTTRQDFQLHFVHIEDTPDLMRRLAAVGLTTREACGNSVRNVTACPLAGVCRGQAFDVTPYAKALSSFLLGHDDVQDFGRKFKIAFSGCEEEACGLVRMHDLGFLARVRTVQGRPQRGFTVYVGGGLGAVPHQAKVLETFLPEEELLPLAQAVARVFTRHGEKRNRNRARLKFLVADWGIDRFREEVQAERHRLPPDPRWTAYLADVPAHQEMPRREPVFLDGQERPPGFDAWHATNVYHQRQPGYTTVTVKLPLGDISSHQMRSLADIAREYVGDHVRTTVEQNIVLRWVAEGDLPRIYRDLRAIGLAEAGAGTILDIVSCPGTDTCKLGIAASRGLASELRRRLSNADGELPEPIQRLRIKISGCFNSCGQHHVADIGFFGNSRRAGHYKVPSFQVVLGGRWRQNAGSYGMAIGAVPSKAVPQVLEAITRRYLAERRPDEPFQDWIARLGKAQARKIIEPYMQIPRHEEQPDYFVDWGDARLFTIGDIGVGECAGEVVSLFGLEIAKAESLAFEAQLALEAKDFTRAEELAYRAMLQAARALLLPRDPDVGQDPDTLVAAFKRRLYDTQLFFDPYARGKFARYLLDRHAHPPDRLDEDVAHQRVDEAQLFIEAAHACDARLAAEEKPLRPR